MKLRMPLSTLCLLVAVVALGLFLALITARHNAQLMVMTARHNAQLAEMTARHNAQLAKMAAEHNDEIRGMTSRYDTAVEGKKARNSGLNTPSEAAGAGSEPGPAP